MLTSGSSLQGVAVFNNSLFGVVYPSCEPAVMMTKFPPDSSQKISVSKPGSNATSQVLSSKESQVTDGLAFSH